MEWKGKREILKREMVRRTERVKVRLTNMQIGRQMNRQKYGQKDRQTEK
jgi:hypothetical protein